MAVGRLDTDEGREARTFTGTNGALVTLFLHSSGFTNAVAQVVQLGAADVADCNTLYLGKSWRVQREGSFDSNTKAQFTDREGFPNSRALTSYYIALEKLGSFTVTFDYSNMNFDRVARTEFRMVSS